MARVLAVVFILLSASLAWAARSGDELRPIAAAEAERRASETRDFIVDLLWEHTDPHWHVGEYVECIRLCRQSVELDPHFVDAWTSGAWLLSNLGRDAEAIEMYRAGIAANPDRFEIHQDFGLLYHRRQKYDEAVEQFRKAVENGAPRAWQHMLPNTLELAGRKQEALEEWRALLKRFPEDDVAGKHIARLEGDLAPEPGYH